MSTYLVRISERIGGRWFGIKLVQRILTDLDELKAGHVAIEDHLRRQDLMLLQLLEETLPPPVVHAVFCVVYESGVTVEEATAVEMKINQKFACTVVFKDSAGNVATVDEPPVWSADPPNVLTLAPEADGLSVMVSSGTTAGSAQLLCKADADMGAGTTEITGMLAVTVLPGDATTVELNPGEVEDADARRRKRAS